MDIEPLGGEFQMRQILENSPNDNQHNDFVLFADIGGDGFGEKKNQQIHLIHEDEGKRRVDGGNRILEEFGFQLQDFQVVQQDQRQVQQVTGDGNH